MVLLRQIQRDALLEMCPRRVQLGDIKRRRPKGDVGREQEDRVVHVVREAQQLFTEFARLLQTAADEIKDPQREERHEALRGFP
jgi:hypothetical protein